LVGVIDGGPAEDVCLDRGAEPAEAWVRKEGTRRGGFKDWVYCEGSNVSTEVVDEWSETSSEVEVSQ